MLPRNEFWSRVDKRSDGCWLWPSIAHDGYGRYYHFGRTPQRAHRVAWILTHGPIPDGMYVCHSCDVRLCVNPEHLFLGTASDNTRDSVRKGRWIKRGRVKELAGRHAE